MKITNFYYSEIDNSLKIVINNPSSLGSLFLWTDITYKNENEKIDLSSYLNTSTTQTISLSPSDIDSTIFDGIYYISASDNIEESQSLTSILTKYKECIVKKLSSIPICNDCLKNSSSEVITSHMLLIGVEYSTNQGLIDEAINNLKALKKYCSNECSTCGKYSNIVNNPYL